MKSPFGEAEAAAVTRGARRALLAAIGITVLLYVIPGGDAVAWPLLLLSTLAHELGHGLAGVLVGGDFESLRIWSDGSGVARVSGLASRRAWGLVSAGGLVGPALAAAGLFLCARGPRVARAALLASGALLVLALPLFVRGAFGLVFVAAVAAAVVALGLVARGAVPQTALAFLAVQLALSVFSRGDYLFAKDAQTGAGRMPSDVANMATALGGPYWLWGLLCGAFSVLVLVAGTWLFLRGDAGARGLPRIPRPAVRG